jgi:amidase
MGRTKNDKIRGASRRSFLKTTVIGGTAATLAPLYPALGAAREIARPEPKPDIKAFELDEMTISDLQDGMKSGRFTARSLVEKYSARIDEIDKHGPSINSVLELNPDALSIADALDQERQLKGPRGSLHGIPVLIKDNIDTADRMMTTAGSLALVGSKPAKDSFVAERLRAPSSWAKPTSANGRTYDPVTRLADGVAAAG